MANKFLTYDGVEIIKQYIDTSLESKADLEHGCHIPTPEPYNNARFLRNDNSWKTIMPEHIGAATQDHNHNGLYLRKYTLPNNIETNFNLLENLTLSGRGEPTTGANLVNAPWTDMGPVGGFGVLTYLWSGYGIQMAWGYNSNRIYIRNKYYNQSINNSGQGESFDTLMSYTLGLNAYDSTSGGSTIQRAVINGRDVSNVIKLGKGTSGGSVTIHIPDGTLTIGLYVVAWKSDPKTILMCNLGSEYLEIKPTTNEGATGNPPYTITVTNSDYYTINIPAGVTQITLSTEDKSNRRAVLFGVNAIAFSEAIWDNKWDSIALTSDIPVLTGGKKATSGKYVSGVTVNGHEITVTQVDLPTSLPANGGNSDTVGNKSASDFMPAGDTTHGMHVTADAQTWNGIKTFTSEVILSGGGTHTNICEGIETAFKTNRIMSNEIFANTIYLGDSNKDSKSDQSLVIKKYNGVSNKAPSAVSDLVTINTNGQITATGGFNGNCTSASEWADFPTNTTGLDFNNLNNVTGYFQYASHQGTNTPYINFTNFKDVGSIMQFGNAFRKGQFVIGNRAYDYLNTAGKLTPEGLYFRKSGEGSDNKATGSHPIVWDPWREIPMIDSTGNLVVTSLSSYYNTSTNNYGLTIPFNTNVTGVLKVNGKEVALADNIPEDVDLTSINAALENTIPAQFAAISGQIEQINLDRQALGNTIETLSTDVSTLKTNLNVTKGSTTKPIYLNSGVPAECTHVLEQSVTTSSKLTDTNYYPTTFTWTAGTTEGPTGSLTGTETEMPAVTFGAIPAASGKAYYDDELEDWVQTQSVSSGIVTTEKQTFSGQKFFNDGIWLGTGEYREEVNTDAVKIHFGDTDGIWIGETPDDSLTITADVLTLNAVTYYNGEEIAVKSDIAGGGSTKVKSTSTKFYITGCTSSPTTAGITPSNFVANTAVNVQNGTQVYASGGFFQSSDITLKDIHENIDVDLDKLSQLNKIYFNYKYDIETTHIGIIAQELQKLYPELVSEDVETGKLSVEYDKLSVIALSAIDKLNEENKKLNEKLQNIENILKNKGIM